MAYTLYIGNKNYSSWSMRPWVLMRQLNLPFAERMVRFDAFTPDSQFKQTLAPFKTNAKVPLLVDDGLTTAGGHALVVHDTLSIVEHLADRHPDAGVWPQHPVHRALVRSACAEMHSGFMGLRSHCPMNIEAHLPDVGRLLLRDQPSVRHDLARLEALWTQLLIECGGPYLGGTEFGAVDAYFAPVVMRIRTYALPTGEAVAAYLQRVQQLSAVQTWGQEARAEADFLAFEEPYRLHR